MRRCITASVSITGTAMHQRVSTGEMTPTFELLR
jgi:hypothetical protein